MDLNNPEFYRSITDWKPYPEEKPKNAEECLVVTVKTDNNIDHSLTVYFDGNFYRLELDPAVGTLRKAVVNNVVAWR